MKLSDYAKKAGVSYKTAHRWWKAGQLNGYQVPSTGTIIIDSANPIKEPPTDDLRTNGEEDETG